MDKCNGIDTPFTNAIFTPPSADAQAGGGTKGGFDIPDGKKQDTGGETGSWATTVDLKDGEAPGMGGRPKGMGGS